MSVPRLRDELDRIEQRISTSGYASLLAGSVALPDASRGAPRFLNMKDFAATQRKCLDAVDASVQSVLASNTYDKICLFLGGSLARLEYIPGSSDLDLLAVDGSVGREEWRKLQGIEHFESACTESDRFAQFERLLIDTLTVELPRNKLGNCKSDGVDARPFVGRKLFFTEPDLFEELGKPHEANWAAFARAVLLFEAVGWGNPEHVLHLRSLADETYGLTQDITNGVFPAMTCSFISFLAKSGLLAKLGLLRKPSKQNGATLQLNIQTEGTGNQESELMKAVFSRQWYAAINRTFVQALYWSRTVAPEKVRDQDHLRLMVSATPIGKLVLYLPSLVQNVDASAGDLWNILKSNCPDRDREELKEELKKTRDAIRASCAWVRPGSSGLPLWMRFLQMLALCVDIRKGSKRLDAEILENMHQIGKELEQTLENALWLTTHLLRATHADRSVYQQLATYVAREIA